MTDIDPDSEPAPPLTWRVWLLLPLALAGAFGLVVSLGPHFGLDLRKTQVIQSLPRAPYDSELLDLVQRETLDPGHRAMLRNLHDECMATRNAAGLIPGRLRRRVDAMLERFGGK